MAKYTDPVVYERMPDYLRGLHRAARNWGVYPHNGAERVIIERTDAEDDEYDHIVHDATQADFERYPTDWED